MTILRLVRVAVAALSPEVASAQELERAWLTLQFYLAYQILRGKLRGWLARISMGLATWSAILRFAWRQAMNELGEQAMLAAGS